jgi:putative transcriptional regulator
MKTKKPKTAVKQTRLGKALIAGMKEAVAHAQGKMALPTYSYHAPRSIEVAPIRKQLGLSQSGFANAFGLNVSTLRDWEQGRRQPDGMARILLAVIDRNPKLVQQVLKDYQ